jgi:hypothetical protein
MKKYYIHLNGNQEGPFSFDELKAKKISPETMIWFEGAENWNPANSIQELNDLFKVTPPPIKTTTPPPLQNESSDAPNAKKSSKMVVFLGIALVGVLVIAGVLYNEQQKKQEQIELQLQEQKAKIEEQERIEAQRVAEEQRKREAAAKQQREEQRQELKNQYDNAITSLRYAREKLEQIKQFQLLRTSSEKQQQIHSQLEVIRSWENEAERIKNELDKF